jgi:hypothetical protein
MKRNALCGTTGASYPFVEALRRPLACEGLFHCRSQDLSNQTSGFSVRADGWNLFHSLIRSHFCASRNLRLPEGFVFYDGSDERMMETFGADHFERVVRE